MRADDFDYELPPELIAQYPPERREGGRLLRLQRPGGEVSHRRIEDLPELLPPGCLLVVNDSRVIPARIWARRPTGGRVEVLLVEPEEDLAGAGGGIWHCMVRSSKSLREGELLRPEPRTADVPAPALEVVSGSQHGRCRLRIPDLDALLAHGSVPLPPYIERSDEPLDRERYQTVYARDPGSVAAPTAGLHLSEALLERLERAGIERCAVTLHVGPGTFVPVRCESVETHQMESERFFIPEQTAAAIARAKAQGRPVVAVGTTAVRALEASGGQPGAGRTALFIYPGFRFQVVDGLLTNFHLPRSTLIMLVSAFAGQQQVLAAYRRAVAERYRFYSFGDAMLVL